MGAAFRVGGGTAGAERLKEARATVVNPDTPRNRRGRRSLAGKEVFRPPKAVRAVRRPIWSAWGNPSRID